MVKKSSLFLLAILFSTSLFASGHGLNGLEVIYEIAIGAFIYVILFVVLTILTAINKSKPQKARTIVYTVLLSMFSVVFLFALIGIATVSMEIGGSGLTIATLPVLIFSVLLILNVIFLSGAYKQLKK